TNYIVKRSLVSSGPYTNLLIQSPVNAATDSAVAPGATYYYVVSAANGSGVSGDSAEISLSTAPPVPPVLQVWLKADALSRLTNGAAVASWPDSTGNGYQATQNTPSRRPTFITAVINGLPVVRFNTTNSTYLAFARPVQDDFTIFCVYRSSQGIGTGTQFYQG